jgi:hypothetical protein
MLPAARRLGIAIGFGYEHDGDGSHAPVRSAEAAFT